MSQYILKKVFPYSTTEVFAVFHDQFKQTFPLANILKPIGACAERDAAGVQGYTFHLSMQITDYEENRVYELTTRSSNKQIYVTRYELTPLEDGSTLLALGEEITTPGFFGSANAILTQIFFKKRARKKAERLFQSIETELARKSNG